MKAFMRLWLLRRRIRHMGWFVWKSVNGPVVVPPTDDVTEAEGQMLHDLRIELREALDAVTCYDCQETT